MNKGPCDLLLGFWLSLSNKVHLEALLIERNRGFLLIRNEGGVLRCRHGARGVGNEASFLLMKRRHVEGDAFEWECCVLLRSELVMFRRSKKAPKQVDVA